MSLVQHPNTLTMASAQSRAEQFGKPNSIAFMKAYRKTYAEIVRNADPVSLKSYLLRLDKMIEGKEAGEDINPRDFMDGRLKKAFGSRK